MSVERDREYAVLLAQRNAAYQALVRHAAQLTITLERANAAFQPDESEEDDGGRGA